ncbi:uncharacterized protein LOC125200337, partial [Salvia hispanica]|uniref:uncharacterized protein LOC125200337 n=1 Tax=Salvia hispanica TaxID=49212 RepID=UPI0020094DC6
MRSRTTKYGDLVMLLEDIMLLYRVETTDLLLKYMNARTRLSKRRILDQRHSILNKMDRQIKHLDRLIHISDADCIANLRMDRNTFGRLCRILYARGGLRIGRTLGIEEQVAMFLGVLAHHDKNRRVKFQFWRSGATVSQCVHKVMCAILSLHSVLMAKPTPVPENCTDHRWKWFKGCLGALDGTHINVLVRTDDKPRYRTRKG